MIVKSTSTVTYIISFNVIICRVPTASTSILVKVGWVDHPIIERQADTINQIDVTQSDFFIASQNQGTSATNDPTKFVLRPKFPNQLHQFLSRTFCSSRRWERASFHYMVVRHKPAATERTVRILQLRTKLELEVVIDAVVLSVVAEDDCQK